MRKKFKMPGVRYLFIFLSFISLITNYTIRVNLNVAIVAMVNSSVVYKHGNKSTSGYCSAAPDASSHDTSIEDIPMKISHEEENMSLGGEFLWSPATQGVVLGAFYYGYCCFQIIAGRLSEIYSGKWVFAIGTFVASLLALVTPVAARFSVTALVFVRALQGISQGVMLPAMYSMVGRWLPDSERGVFSAFIYSGINIGIVVGMTASGFLCNSSLFNGWPSAFYVFGFINCLSIIVWSVLVTNSPVSHPFITKAELKHIVANQKTEMNKYIPPIPWKKILTSVPVWALIATLLGADWIFYILLNELPTFFATVLHFDIEKNGLLSSAPFLLKAITGILVGFATDAMIHKRLATVNFIRKFCSAVALLGTAVGLIGVCLAGCNATLCVIFLMSSIPAFGFSYSGYLISHLDMSPEYAGTLMGMTNTFSSLMGFSAPMFVGFLIKDHQNIHEWHTVFGIAVALVIFACIVYTIFGSTKKQNWIKEEPETAALTQNSQSYKTI